LLRKEAGATGNRREGKTGEEGGKGRKRGRKRERESSA